jgi:hypothetical protein
MGRGGTGTRHLLPFGCLQQIKIEGKMGINKILPKVKKRFKIFFYPECSCLISKMVIKGFNASL